MAQLAGRTYSRGEYFLTERMSDIKHEYYAGSIYAMAGGSPRHSRIAGNIFVALDVGLRGSSCQPFGSDLRIYTPSGLYTYPDVSVVCGPLEFTDDPDAPSETVTNPTVLVEVLSDSTRDYDRGGKFELYRAIPTLRDYILIEQSFVYVEHHTLTDAGAWTGIVFTAPADVLELPSLHFRTTLREIYQRVEFGA